MGKYLVFTLLCFFSTNSIALNFGGGNIIPPNGFEGPVVKEIGQGAKSIAYFKGHGNQFKTLLQLNVFETGKEIPSMSERELKQGLSRYLLQFLSGVARKRENFSKGSVEYISIAGTIAARIHWSGDAKGKELEGIMYCYINGSKVISLHTQDLATRNGVFLKQAAQSLESIRR